MNLGKLCPVSKPRWCRRKDARPSELTAAALELFVERGFAATRLDDVARAAGVSKGTLYLYFSSKEELFKAVIQEGIVPLIEEGEAMLAHSDLPSRALLHNLVMNWWQRIGATSLGGVSKLMIAEASNFPEVAAYFHEQVVMRGRDLLRRILKQGIARGEFRAVDIEMQLRILWAPVLMAGIWRHSLGACERTEIPVEQYFAAYFDVVEHGLLSQPDAGEK